MKVSRKSIYGVRALIEICLRVEERQTPWQQIPSIASTTQIPEKFLEQILLTLKKSGFLKSRRGVDGGYALAIPANEISLDRLIQALDGRMLPEEEIDEGPDGSGLVFRQAVANAEEAALNQLRAVTLADLAAQTRQWRQKSHSGLEFQI